MDTNCKLDLSTASMVMLVDTAQEKAALFFSTEACIHFLEDLETLCIEKMD